MITASLIYSGKGPYTTIRHTIEKIRPSQELRDQDIVYVLTSETIDDLGHAYLFNNPRNLPAVAGTETTIMRVKDQGLILPPYLNYLAQTPRFKALLRQYVKGMKVFRVHPSDLARIEISLPDLRTQQKIVSFVDSMRYQELVLVKLNDYLAELVSLMFEQLIEKCVETVPLSTYVTISSGKRPPIKSPVFTDECVFPLFGASSQMGYTSEYLTDEKLLVIGRVGTHGVIQRVSGKAWPSDNTLVIRSDHYETASQLLQRVDYPSLNRGSTQPLITQGDLKNYEVPRISPVALERFEDQAGQLMSLYDHNCIESAKLIKLRDALLPRLMSGELDVSGVTI